jgi:hypothetical protein
MLRLFKIAYTIDNEIKKIFVFCGDNISEKEKNISNKEIFNEKTQELIKKDNPEIIFINLLIHEDDTIETIKKKIVSNCNLGISIPEIYLFGKERMNISSEEIYKALTRNDTNALTKETLFQFLSQFQNINISVLEDKKVYDYDDVVKLDLNSELKINKPIGQKFTSIETNYSYTVNPFDLTVIDKYLETHVENFLSSTNRSLLINIKNLENDFIFLCLANDVLSSLNTSIMSHAFAIQTYYPLLYDKEIKSLEELNEIREKLIIESEKMIDANFKTNDKIISTLINLFELRRHELNYISKGIKSIKLELTSEQQIKMPLDIIFKLFHANKQYPLVKFNPDKKLDNLYRLYAPNNSINGKKIPILSKSDIKKDVMNIGRNKSVTIHISDINENPMYCELTDEGFIKIDLEFKSLYSPASIENLIQKKIQPLIDEISNLIQHYGYSMPRFTNITSNNVEVTDLNYEIKFPLTTEFDLKPFQKCLSSIFNIIDIKNLNKGFLMRYKRVSNYNKMAAEDRWIYDMLKNDEGENEILTGLKSNFGHSDEVAKQKYNEFASRVEIEEEANQKNHYKIKDDPGFKTTMIKEKYTNNLIINVNGIDRLDYIERLPLYLDSIIRMIEDPESSEVSVEDFGKVCSGKEIKELKEMDEVIAINEQRSFVNKQLNLESTDIVQIVDKDNENDLYNMLLDEEDEEEREKSISNAFTSESEKSKSEKSESEKSESEKSESEKSESEKSESEKSESEKSEKSVNKNKSKNSSISSDVSEQAGPIKQPSLDDSSNESSSDSKKMSKEIKEAQLKKKVKANQEATLLEASKLEESNMAETSKKTPVTVTSDSETNNNLFGSNLRNALSESESGSDFNSGTSGGTKNSKSIKDVTGMSLTRSPFLKKMTDLEPKLFLKRKDGKFDSYSRVCPANNRRQPIILTNEEKMRIDREHPDSYTKALEYGTTDKKYWYICPRYWSLTQNTSLTEEEAQSGKYGGIIPTDSKTIAKGDEIYEFAKGSEHFKGTTKKYINHYPGFLDKENHPDNKCIPCCFKDWNSKLQIARRSECLNNENKTNIKISKLKSNDNPDDYINKAESFPLKQAKYGFLPESIQQFLHTDNAKCINPNNKHKLKPFHYCILRHGVENHNKQSFIACISEIYSKENNIPLLTISEFKKKIVNELSLDQFINLQNGNLIQQFDNGLETNIEKYSDSSIYKKTNKDNKAKLLLLKKMIRAFEGFKSFLLDDEVIIDHTHLWDYVCQPNPQLFKDGINLVIINPNSDDSTDNMNILCPTNSYSSNLFDINKKTAILMYKDLFFEPIYQFYDIETTLHVNATFSIKNSNLMGNIKSVLENIKRFINNTCLPNESIPEVYEFARNISLFKLIQLLSQIEIKPISQVLNYDGKVIGVTVNYMDDIAFIPCYPSGLIESDMSISWIDELTGMNYEKTRDFLKEIYKKSKKQIPCDPKLKIMEDKLIIGIITKTNQFVQLSEPSPNIYNDDDLIEFKDTNHIILDKKIMTSVKKDIKRVEFIKNISLENNFFSIFRNTIRIILNKLENKKEHATIMKINKSPISYKDKLKKVRKVIYDLVKNVFEFIIYEKDVLYKLKDITNCYLNDDESCGEKNFCLIKKENECVLLIPKRNLINGKDNEEMYFGRIADEIVRYNRIKSFILKSNMFLAFQDVKYNLRDDEIILSQAIILEKEGYFDDNMIEPKNPYIKKNTYDTSKPFNSNYYSNVITSKLMKQFQDKEVDCDKNIKSKEIDKKWKKTFPEKSKFLYYSKLPEICTFQFIKIIIDDYLKDEITSINSIKEKLVTKYKKLYLDNPVGVTNVLNSQGKKNLAKQILSGQVKIEDIILSPEYYLTNLDIWIIAKIYNLPIILFSKKTLLENKESLLILNKSNNNKYYFIKCPGIKIISSTEEDNEYPVFYVVSEFNNTLLLDLETLSNKYKKKIINQENTISENNLIEYINKYSYSKKEARELILAEKTSKNKKSRTKSKSKSKSKSKFKSKFIIIDESKPELKIIRKKPEKIELAD